MELNALVAPLRADIQGGAAEITLRAIDAYEQVLEGARSFRALLDELEQLSLQMIDAQRAMAPLLHLAGRVLEAPVEESELAPARAVTRQALDAFRDELRQAPAKVAERAEALIPAGGKVLTVSSSSTVRAALLEAARRRSFSVVCIESRPNMVGRGLEADLAQAGLYVSLSPDAGIT